MLTFVEMIDERMKVVDKTGVGNFCAKETHKRFVEALDQLDQEKLVRNFGGFKNMLTHKNITTCLNTKLNTLSWLFGDGVMAPKGMKEEDFCNALLKEWRSLIPSMMESSGRAEKKTKR